ncbi:MAG: YccF domain-containing protein [Clostridia bacterium]
MKTLINILWFVFGGLPIALCWAASGVILCCTIIGIPFGIQCFKMARLVMWPLGTDVNYNMGVFKGIFNILWACTLGLVFGLISLLCGILWCVTLIGIPIGIQWFKVAKLSFMPFGTTVI